MKYSNIKVLFTLLIFSLFIFANPTVNTISFDTASESELVLELEEELEEDNDREELKNTFFSVIAILCNGTCNSLNPIYTSHLYTHKTNVSLLKPPIQNS